MPFLEGITLPEREVDVVNRLWPLVQAKMGSAWTAAQKEIEEKLLPSIVDADEGKHLISYVGMVRLTNGVTAGDDAKLSGLVKCLTEHRARLQAQAQPQDADRASDNSDNAVHHSQASATKLKARATYFTGNLKLLGRLGTGTTYPEAIRKAHDHVESKPRMRRSFNFIARDLPAIQFILDSLKASKDGEALFPAVQFPEATDNDQRVAHVNALSVIQARYYLLACRIIQDYERSDWGKNGIDLKTALIDAAHAAEYSGPLTTKSAHKDLQCAFRTEPPDWSRAFLEAYTAINRHTADTGEDHVELFKRGDTTKRAREGEEANDSSKGGESLPTKRKRQKAARRDERRSANDFRRSIASLTSILKRGGGRGLSKLKNRGRY